MTESEFDFKVAKFIVNGKAMIREFMIEYYKNYLTLYTITRICSI